MEELEIISNEKINSSIDWLINNGNYTVREYSKEISKYPLLTIEEETNIGNILYNIKNNEFTIVTKNHLVLFDYRKLFINLSKIEYSNELLKELKRLLTNSLNTKLYKPLSKYIELITKKNRFLNIDELGIFNFKLIKIKELKTKKLLNSLNNYNKYLEARKKMINSNLKLVVYLSRRYHYVNASLMDIINDGNEGLMIAVDRLNIKKGFRFSTYASLWIEHTIRKAIPHYKPITITQYRISEMEKFNNKVNELEEKTNKKYTNKQLSEILNVDYDLVLSYRNLNPDASSLDEPLKEDKTLTLIDVISNNDNGIENLINDHANNEVIELLTSTLSDRDKDILLNMFGVKNKMTSIELADIYKISFQRVLQIKDESIEKLKKYVKRKDLNHVLDD